MFSFHTVYIFINHFKFCKLTKSKLTKKKFVKSNDLFTCKAHYFFKKKREETQDQILVWFAWVLLKSKVYKLYMHFKFKLRTLIFSCNLGKKLNSMQCHNKCIVLL